MDEFELALGLKRAMREYSYNSINEHAGLGVFRSLLDGEAVLTVTFRNGKLAFKPYTPPQPKKEEEQVLPGLIRDAVST